MKSRNLDREYARLRKFIEEDENAAGLQEEREEFFQSYANAVADCRDQYRE
jgi:hypothetical protein